MSTETPLHTRRQIVTRLVFAVALLLVGCAKGDDKNPIMDRDGRKILAVMVAVRSTLTDPGDQARVDHELNEMAAIYHLPVPTLEQAQDINYISGRSHDRPRPEGQRRRGDGGGPGGKKSIMCFELPVCLAARQPSLQDSMGS